LDCWKILLFLQRKEKKYDDSEGEHIIEKIKRNIRQNNNDKILNYQPTDHSLTSKVTRLDIVNDKESIIEIHSNVLQNENKAKIFVLYEAYFRGKFYKELSDKFKKNDEFLSYCENYLNVSVPTVYQYRNLYLLIAEYPSLILSGVCITKLHKNRKKNLQDCKV